MDQDIHIWDLRCGKSVQTHHLPASVRHVDFHPSGKYLISSSEDAKIRVKT